MKTLVIEDPLVLYVVAITPRLIIKLAKIVLIQTLWKGWSIMSMFVQHNTYQGQLGPNHPCWDMYWQFWEYCNWPAWLIYSNVRHMQTCSWLKCNQTLLPKKDQKTLNQQTFQDEKRAFTMSIHCKDNFPFGFKAGSCKTISGKTWNRAEYMWMRVFYTSFCRQWSYPC